MILLFGGTGETAELATALASLGQPVLVSTATDVPLNVGSHPLIEHIRGRLDEIAMLALVKKMAIRLLVDAGHPFAEQLHTTVAQVASLTRIPCLCYRRASLSASGQGLYYVDSHEEAAKLAASFDKTILLTTGSRNLEPYVATTKARSLPLYARVLPHAESEAACEAAGLAKKACIFARGPFSVEQNRDLLRRLGIGVMVSKDSGICGGVEEKLKAAATEEVMVVMIRQPDSVHNGCHTFTKAASLLVEAELLLSKLNPSRP
ncbi:precorrin-6A reductase [Trichloromonas sp.]|uniref:precorrin-6A reductase n=1 Tax=Trichloromonas sp. TaxID=3069249 RepID=UPI001DCC4457|nr:precorrin-6A reductase [Desulfuromonadaceae bacterium]MDY0269851.1 precorrin-6A reductase [Trichloromonas sp.]